MNKKAYFILQAFFLVCFLLVSSNGYSQIELSKESIEKEDKKKKKEKVKERIAKDTLSKTSIFVNANWSYTTRKLIENDGLFGDSLGERANETPGNKWSFGLGFRNQIHENIAMEGGISFLQNSEKYSFEGVDSSYSYESNYAYIAMPIKLLYTYGKEIKFLAGVGITPQMFLRYKQNREWINSEGETVRESIKKNTGFNSFVLSATVSAGVQFQLGKRWGVQVIPEYRIQLTTSNSKKDSYKHYARAFGVNAGIVFQL